MSYIEEWAEAYEQKYGKWPSEPALEVAQHIEKVGTMFREEGRKDAQSAQEPRRIETFARLAQYAFHYDLDEETARIIGDLWQAEYMKGYQEGGAA